MADHEWTFCGARVTARADGSLWLGDAGLLVVSDLHFGKAERIARREGRLTPPYEARETAARLGAAVDAVRPSVVICLGDSFDDNRSAENLDEEVRRDLTRMMAGRRWIWIAGNHDPAPVGIGGSCLAEAGVAGLVFRHIAEPDASGEVSGHYHPKVRLRGPSRPSFLIDKQRIIMPAFGVYTGGLNAHDAVFDDLMSDDAVALMTGRKIIPCPRAGLRSGIRARG